MTYFYDGFSSIALARCLFSNNQSKRSACAVDPCSE